LLKNLLPTEWFEFGLGDVSHGLAAALTRKEPNRPLSLPGLGSCIPVRSARTGIVIALKALRLPAGARIGVPLYCCPVVFKAIKMAGCTARFIDIEADTYCLSPEDLMAKRSDVDAVIAVHMFGNLCDMNKLYEAAGSKPIIEDCAQSLGSRLDGRMTGSLGTIGVFSFRSGKYLSVGEGGALFSIDPHIHSRMSQLVDEMPTPNRMEECVHVAETFLRTKLRSKPLYGLVGYHLWEVYNKKVDFTKKSPLVLGRIYKADLATTRNRFQYLDSVIERQRSHADLYSQSLKLDPDMLCIEKPGRFYNRYLYPIIFSSPEHRDFVAAYLRRGGIDSSQPYKDVADGAAEYYGYTGDCPVSERVAKNILVFPSYAALREKDVLRIAKSVNEAWTEIISRRAPSLS
jgi:perosamine synthetase